MCIRKCNVCNLRLVQVVLFMGGLKSVCIQLYIIVLKKK